MILIQAAVWQKVGWFPAALEKGWTDRRYHTGDEKKDRSEAKLLIDFRKATGPTHTHTHTRFPKRRCQGSGAEPDGRTRAQANTHAHTPPDDSTNTCCRHNIHLANTPEGRQRRRKTRIWRTTVNQNITSATTGDLLHTLASTVEHNC